MQIDIITIFPKIFDNVFNESIIKRARNKGLLKINIRNLRDYSRDKHRKVDDRPFGGGPGMVMRPESLFAAIEDILGIRSSVIGPRYKSNTKHLTPKTKTILLSPQGEKLNQKIAQRLMRYKRLILICGHYEGIDERVRQHLADEEISIGDYVLTGGEIPAMVLVDSIARLIPGVLGKKESLHQESFNGNLLEYPQYTRPANFRGLKVPAVLLSGNHREIAAWRKRQALKVTRLKRPDLLMRPKLMEQRRHKFVGRINP